MLLNTNLRSPVVQLLIANPRKRGISDSGGNGPNFALFCLQFWDILFVKTVFRQGTHELLIPSRGPNCSVPYLIRGRLSEHPFPAPASLSLDRSQISCLNTASHTRHRQKIIFKSLLPVPSRNLVGFSDPFLSKTATR